MGIEALQGCRGGTLLRGLSLCLFAEVHTARLGRVATAGSGPMATIRSKSGAILVWDQILGFQHSGTEVTEI